MKTILVVDDESALVETLTDLLQYEGYRVISANNGETALARLLNDKPDLILTDFMMPLSNGLDLIRSVHALPAFREVPVVMMSAVSKSIAVSSNLDRGPLKLAGYLNKPFQLEPLLALVAKLIGKAA